MVCDCCCVSTLIYGLGLFTLGKLIFPFVKKFIFKDKHPELIEKDWKKDVVYLHQFNGTSTMTSVSPFCVKVETYLRVHNIKYERRYTMSGRGKNDKLPCVELNGEQISDSHFILKRLAQKFNIKDYANARDAGLGHAVDRMVDIWTFNLIYPYKNMKLVLKAVAGEKMGETLIDLLAPVVRCYFGCKMVKRTEAAIGKFTVDEKKELLRDDFIHLREILGDKKFLFGNEPTAADCTLFGQLSTVYYLEPNATGLPYDMLNSSEFSSLKEWLVRMRERCFENDFHM